MSVDIGGLPSWILVLGIGIGILWAISNGMLDATYRIGESALPMESLGGLLVIAAILLGAFYFLKDIGNKV